MTSESTQTQEPGSESIRLTKFLGTTIAYALMTGWFLLFVIGGCLTAHIGYCDPDSCWLLYVGRWIYEHHHLPLTDSISSSPLLFTNLAPGTPVVDHEWLSEVFLYSAMKAFGLAGPLCLVSVLAVGAFVVIPSLVMRRSNVNNVLASLVLAAGYAAAAFRFWVRPEIFSFLYFSGVIAINEAACIEQDKRRFWLSCLAISICTAAWANSHASFTLGIAYLGLYHLLLAIQDSLAEKRLVIHLKSAVLLLSACLGTFITPWGYFMWVASFTIGTSPIHKIINEYQPSTLADASNPTFWPLLLLVGIVLYELIQALLKRRSRNVLLPFALILLAVGGSIVYRRLVPFCILFLLVSLSKLWSLKATAKSSAPSLRAAVTEVFGRMSIPWGAFCHCVIALLVSFFCVFAAANLSKPTVPSQSRAFTPPFAAISWLSHNGLPPGRLLNDSQFGSTMIWVMPAPPDVFLDGRMDSRYTDTHIYDFQAMRLCGKDWRQLLDRNAISWIFFTPDTPLVKSLLSDPGWHKIYGDANAVIVVRNNPLPYLDR